MLFIEKFGSKEESNMLRRIETRSFEECEMIVRLWLEGSREEAIEILGAEPTDDFLSSFKPTAPVLPAPETPVKRKKRVTQSR
jgi:hypothetical protein